MITVVGNLKGGTGKSTVNFNLALWLTCQQRPVVVFDLDPQRTLSDVAEVRREEGYAPQLDLHYDLARFDPPDQAEVLVDVGLADRTALNTALKRADRIIVPVPPSQADVWATQRFLDMIKAVRKANAVDILAFINRADTHRGVRETAETAEALHSLSDLRLLEVRLHQRTDYRRSFSEGLAVFELQPSGKAAQEIDQLARLLYA